MAKESRKNSMDKWMIEMGLKHGTNFFGVDVL